MILGRETYLKMCHNRLPTEGAKLRNRRKLEVTETDSMPKETHSHTKRNLFDDGVPAESKCGTCVLLSCDRLHFHPTTGERCQVTRHATAVPACADARGRARRGTAARMGLGEDAGKGGLGRIQGRGWCCVCMCVSACVCMCMCMCMCACVHVHMHVHVHVNACMCV